jgi:pimeloyl-ACP methyl ester carboxylesterase
MLGEVSQVASVSSHRRDLPIEERWAKVQGARMRYLCAGSGPPLLLLHGLLGYSFSWRFVIPVLAKESTVYAPDMLGAGFSECPANLECSLHACAERVLLFADHLGIESFDLLGTSHGGAVAMMVAARAAEKQRDHVRSLILVAPVNPWSNHGRRLAPFLSRGLVAKLFPAIAPRATFAHGWILRRLYGDTNRISAGTLEGYKRPFETNATMEYPIRILSSWGKDLRELETRLPGIEHLPTLILWGSLDRAVDPVSAQALQSHFRNVRTVTFEGVGHLPYEEVPREFNDAVLAFLQATRKSKAEGKDREAF